jgi:hypothetical protein
VSAEVSNAEWIASFTAEQVMTGLSRAIGERDWLAVEGLMKILAVKDPEKAQAVYDALTIATSRCEDETAATAGEGTDHD